jgi:hypothetical protein
MKIRITKLCALAGATLLLCLNSCTFNSVPTGETQTEMRSVKLGEAKSVRVHLKIGAGELKVTGGAPDLMDADFTYNVPSWKPEIDYNVSAGQGDLTVQQPPGVRGHTGHTHYTWDMHFSNSVPINLSAEMGAGKSEFTLGTLSLRDFDLHLGAGETVVDLTGKWKNDVEARIRGGVGQATIKLPRDVGVQVHAKGGIGQINAEGLSKQGDTYINDAYGKSDVTVRVDVQGGVGQINLQVSEPPPVI